jgi:ribose/xylose/arabinose/galactoside ABC-type transport system permease subunit
VSALEGNPRLIQRFGRSDVLRRFGLWFVFIGVTAFFAIYSAPFRSTFNLENIAQQNAIIGIVACGMTIMIIAGGFDLSVGAVAASSGVLAAVLSTHHSALFVVIACLPVGLVVGFVNGYLIAKVNINPFVATFTMASIVSGVLFVVTGGGNTQQGANSLTTGKSALAVAATGRLGPIPVSFIIFAGCILVCWFLLTRTKFGHYVYGVGGNSEASHLSGVPVNRVKIAAFVLGGLFAAGAGVLVVGETSVGSPIAGASYPLDAIAICVVGGVALTGGVGRIEDVLVACLFLGVIANGLNELSVNPSWQPVVTGVVIIIAVVLDQYNRTHQTASSSGGNRLRSPGSEPDEDGRSAGEPATAQAPSA